MATAQSWLARKTKNAVAESAIRGGDTTDAKRWPCASIDLQIALREPFADSRHSMLMTSAKCYHLIPNPIDQNPWAHWRSPMDMMRQG